MITPDQTEEITFDAPAPEQSMVVNPDVFLDKLLARGRGPSNPMPNRNRIRAAVWKKVLICIPCVHAEHGKCEENGCPCTHHEPERENPAQLATEAEDCCWPV